MQAIFILPVLLAVGAAAHAATFDLRNGQGYHAHITVDCDARACRGPATIVLTGKGRSQTFRSTDVYVPHPDTGQPPTFDDFLEMQDFNFDGQTDLAVPAGAFGPYGSMTYDVYVQTTSGRFVYSEELSELTQMYMGLFRVDQTNQVLKVGGKSGAAVHYEAHYRVRPKRKPGLQEVYWRVSEYWPDDSVRVEERHWRGGQWHTVVKTYTAAQWEAQLERE